MTQVWNRVKIPRISHVCCGYLYDTKNPATVDYFRAFAHKSLQNTIKNNLSNIEKVKFCITVWLICKNNQCVTSFTFYYNNANKLIIQTQKNGIDYILKLKDKFLDNIALRVNIPKVECNSNDYLWRYTNRHPKKKFVSNIYTLNDKKVGETPPQPVTYYIHSNSSYEKILWT